MKPVTFFFIAMAFCLKCFCQKENYDNLFDHLKINYFEIKNDNEAEKIAYPFRNVTIIDKRYDTSCIGYLSDHFLNNEFYKIATRSSLAINIEHYLNLRNIKKSVSSKGDLTMIVRKFWLERDIFYSRVAKHFDHKRIHFFFTFSADFFINDHGSYFPLIKLDTLMELNVSTKNNGLMIGNALDSILLGKAELQQPNISKKKRLSQDFLNSYYAEQMQAPILNSHLPAKGIYMNFNEFKNNTPSITDFQLRKNRFANDVCINVNGAYIPVHDHWGYSDGKKIYIRSNNLYYQLYPQGHSFAIFCNRIKAAMPVSKIGDPNYSGPLNDLLLTDTKMELAHRLATKVDMETGALY